MALIGLISAIYIVCTVLGGLFSATSASSTSHLPHEYNPFKDN
jgi:hypothetical protein